MQVLGWTLDMVVRNQSPSEKTNTNTYRVQVDSMGSHVGAVEGAGWREMLEGNLTKWGRKEEQKEKPGPLITK